MSRRRVVVTGMGVLAPNGNDVDTFWDALISGRSGIGPITRFDASHHEVKIAGEVENFDPTSALDRKEVRRNDPFVHYGVYASCQAAASALTLCSSSRSSSRRSSARSCCRRSPRSASRACR